MRRNNEDILTMCTPVTVCLDLSAAPANRQYLIGSIKGINVHDHGVRYRVAYSAPWGVTSGWFDQSQVSERK